MLLLFFIVSAVFGVIVAVAHGVLDAVHVFGAAIIDCVLNIIVHIQL